MRSPLAKSNKPLFYADDSVELQYIILTTIRREKYFVARPSKHQIKSGAINFFPTTGVITIDGEGRHALTGAEAFWELLKAKYPKHHPASREPQGVPPTLPSDLVKLSKNTDPDDSDLELPW